MKLDDAKEISLEDRSLFNEFFKNYHPQISEFTFSNLFIWKDFYEFKFKIWENHILIFSKTYLNKWKSSISGNKNVIFFLPPIGNKPEDIITELFSNLEYIEIHRVPESIITYFKKENQKNQIAIEVKTDRNNWDYVYERDSLVSLPGNAYRQKRRNLTKFISMFDYKFHFIQTECLELCKELQIEWCDMNECQSNEDLKQEQNAIFNAFNYYEELSLNGGLIMVDGKCIAYTIGEKLNKDTMVIHFEKAHVDYEGSYQAINNLFAKECCKDAKFVNREQDLGISGIRYAKESYKPHHMIKKYILFRND
ncbi:MAG: DUF2156 domain-containing protein [Promethearchaeota archaeon]